MGTVYLGEDAEGTRLAIKSPLPECVADELSVKRFYREARSAGRVKHPNLCSVLDVGRDGRRFYLAMEWIDGHTLAHVLEHGDAPTQDRSLELVATLAEALQAAHEAGIVHRDLKPSNIMLRPDGQPVIIDFGTAKRFDNTETLLTLTGSIVGTPGYMAPEQITSHAGEIGPASDVYSLGVVLYELLGGSPPFTGNFATILGSIVSEPPPPLSLHRVDVAPALEAICAKALAKDPTERFASAREFGEVVWEYLRGGPAAVADALLSAPESNRTAAPRSSETAPDQTTRGLLKRLGDKFFGQR